MKVAYLLCILCSLLCVAYGCQEPEMTKEEIVIEKTIDPAAVPGMMHTVYFWLKEDLPEEDRRHFVDGIRSLEAAETVRRAFIGGPAGTPSRGVVDNSFDYALILWFDDVAGHDRYQTDPVHLKFVEENEEKWTKVVVRDNAVL